MRKTKKTLVEGVERYKDIINNILDLIVEVGAKGKFIFLSPQVYDIFGFRPEELIGLRVYEFIHREYLSYFKESFDKALKLGNPLIVELKLLHKNGHYVSVSMRGRVVNHNSNIKIICVLSDITEHKKVEQKSHNIPEEIREGYYTADLKGNFTFVNDYFCKIIGYTRKELLGKNYCLIFDEKSSKKLFKLFNQISKSGITPPHTNFAKLLTSKGKQVFLEGIIDLIYDSDGTKIGFYGFVRDVTEKVIAEQKLKDSEKKYRKLLENMMVGYNEADFKGNYTFVNDYFCKTIGYSKEELLGKNYRIVFDEKSSKEIFRLFNQVYKTFIPVPHSNFAKMTTNKGKQLFLEGLIDLIYDTEGNKVGFFGLFRDITERIKAEQKLKESEKKYRDILSNIEEGYYEISLDGNFTFVSDFYCKVLGFSKEEVLGKNASLIFDEKSMKNYNRLFAQLYKTGISFPPSNIIEVTTTRGKKISFEGSADLIYDSEGNRVGFFGLARDVSERKHAEQKLKESEKKYRDILENMMEGYYEVDLRGNHTFMNDYYCKTIGYSKEELLGQNFRLRYNEKRSKEVYKLFNQLYKNEISPPLVYENQLITQSGEIIYYEALADLKYDSEGNKVGFFGLIRDITERKKAEEKLKESEHNLKERIKEINCLYGISKLIEKPLKSVDEIIQKTLDLIPPAWQFPNLTCARIIFNNTEFKTYNFKETKWKLSASTEINKKELSIEVYYLKNKHFLEEEEDLTKDIINRLKIIIEKKQAEDNLRQFISIVSHELRTPVTVLVQSTDVLTKYKDKLSKKKKNEMNEMISRNIALLYDLVDDLLVTSRIDEKKIKLTWRKYQPLNLILEIVELMEPRRAAKDITIEVYVDKEIQLYGDSRRISQIFRILIDNAIKYSHEKSKIVFNGIDHYKGKYNSNGIDGILFQFKDFGVGIHEEDLPHLFQRFFRAKNVQRIAGTGLGLCIAKDLINLHKGEIFVESEYGKGSTFSVFLPYLKNI